MIYGIIAISLLVVALCFLILKRIEKGKRNNILKWAGISFGILIVICFIFNLGFYFGCEQQRTILKGEQAFGIALCKKVINEKEDPKKIIDFIFKTKSCALISNIEFDNEPFYEKMLSMGAYRLLYGDSDIDDFAVAVLVGLCVDIESCDIDSEDKELLKSLLKASIEPRFKNRIDAQILREEREKNVQQGEIGVVKFFHPNKRESKSENQEASSD